MASQQLPIKFSKLLDLPALGVAADAIGFATLTLESDKFICAQEPTSKNVVVVDTASSTINRRPINADSSIMNPDDNIIALRSAGQLQVFNLGTKEKLAAHTFTEAISFWKWVDGKTVAMATATAVYHWTIGAGEPKKVFDRHANLQDCQIINYKASSDQKWLCLIGIAQRDGRIVGSMQLYSVERAVSQHIEGHAAGFADFKAEGSTKPSILFAFANRGAAASKLFVIEVAKGDGPDFTKRAVDLFFPPDAAADFPVAMQISEKYNIIYVVTKFGYIHLFDLETGALIYRNRISSETIFVTALHRPTGGICGVDRKGQMLLVAIDEDNIVSYICNTLNNYELAIKLASRSNLPGADSLYKSQFDKLVQSGQYKEAAKIAARSPRGVLRTPETIALFQAIPSQPGQSSPLFQYFATLLESSKLNTQESIELVKPALAQKRIDLVEKWLAEDKITPSEGLGDALKGASIKLALSVYYRAEAHAKVVACFAETGDTDKIQAYCQKVGYNADWQRLTSQLMMSNPDAASALTAKLASTGAAGVDVNATVDSLMQRGMIQQATSLLLDVLKDNKASDGPMQTKLLEMNLISAPQVADAILGNEMFTHYDRLRVAQLSEKAGLFHRALEHYQDLNDIKRVLSNAHMIKPDFLVEFFARLSVDDSLECLKHLLRVNPRDYLQLVVQICAKYSDQLGAANVIEMLETFNATEGMFHYLAGAVAKSTEAVVHNKYIEASAKMGQLKEVERMVRESDHYDAEHVKDFLQQAKLPDQLPLIVVCDRFDFVDDLTRYLYKNNMSRYIEAYVQRINTVNTPIVVGALIDVGCNEDYIKNLLVSVRNMCPVDPLVEQVEKRHKLKMILPWLEQRLQEGNQEASVHNAMGKIYVDMNKDPEGFLNTNAYYDPKVVGKYCEKRDPYLAFVAYKRGRCDAELIDITNKNALFKHQARYLVERQDPALYAAVLTEQNEFKSSVVDQIVGTALPECQNPEAVSVAVKAFMTANMPNELIHLLEKLVLESKNPEFSENRSLQNLLLLTAVRTEPDKVKDLVVRLKKYDGPDVADICIDAGLYEEAFTVYEKFNLVTQAVDVLLTYIKDVTRAAEFAERTGQTGVFSKLATAQLQSGEVGKAIFAFIKAKDISQLESVISTAEAAGAWEDLVKYLEMVVVESKKKNPKVESELAFALAKCHKIEELDAFINKSGCCANVMEVGERCFQGGMFEASKICFTNLGDHGRLSSALVRLGKFAEAVEAAKKDGGMRTWKEVNLACVEAKEFALAQTAGLAIIGRADELDEVLSVYETRGHFEEVINLLEAALHSGETTHQPLYTELAGLYSKYKEEKMLDFIKHHYNDMNLGKVIHYATQNEQYKELVFLYVQYKEPDNAALTMIKHGAVAWEHAQLKDVLKEVSNTDICYQALNFYLTDHPNLAGDMLSAVSHKVDQSRIVNIGRKTNQLPLLKKYLQSIQKANITAVNEALNELYVEEEEFESLRSSIDLHDAYDNIKLADFCRDHEMLEFRRIASFIYKKNGKWAESVELSKRDKLYKDAIQTAAESKKPAVVESLLRFFCEPAQPECFAATLYTCYDSVKPDVALELAWRHKLMDVGMPYLVQLLKEYTTKVDELVAASKPKEADAQNSFHAQPSGLMNQVPQIGYYDTGMGGHGMGGPGMMGHY